MNCIVFSKSLAFCDTNSAFVTRIYYSSNAARLGSRRSENEINRTGQVEIVLVEMI